MLEKLVALPISASSYSPEDADEVRHLVLRRSGLHTSARTTVSDARDDWLARATRENRATRKR